MDTVAAPQGPAGRPVRAADGAAVGAAFGVAVALVGHVGRSPWDVFIGVVLAGLSLALVDGVVTLLRAVLRRILRRPLPAVSAWLGRARTVRLSFPLTGLILVLGPWIGPTTVLRVVHAGAAGSIVVVVATVTGGTIGWARGQASRGARGARVAAAGVLLLAGATLAWLVAPGPGAGIVAPPDPAPVPPLAVADPSLRGPETVRRATYGSGLDPHRAAFGEDADWGTEPIDASRDLVLDPLLSTHVRLVTGARAEALPVNGTVWYPQGARDAPLVLIVHGNHGLSRASDRGYAALADHLASRGAVVVSVDQNFLNGSFVGDSDGREQPVRARMLLEHLHGWERWAGEDGPMDGVVDLDRVAIIGHSRGGEAAAHAAGILQRPETAPAGWALPDRVRVRAVVAIEPTDGQWVPDDGPRQLAGVSYLLLGAGLDGDLNDFRGLAQYHRVDLASKAEAASDDEVSASGDGPSDAGAPPFAAFAYLQRANHGQFNTVWGRDDAGWLNSMILDRGGLLSGEDQQRAGKVLIGAFLDATVGDRPGAHAVFVRPDAARAWLPADVVVTGYRDAASEDLELDPDRGTVSVDGVDDVEQVTLTTRDGRRSLGTRAAWLTWAQGDDPSVQVAVPADLAARDPDDVLTVDYGSADLAHPPRLVVEVEDDAGTRATLPVDRFTALRPPLPARVAKLPTYAARYRVGAELVRPAEHLLQTYELPLAAFTAVAPELDLDRLAAVRLTPDDAPAGAIHLGDVAFRSRSDAERAAVGEATVTAPD